MKIEKILWNGLDAVFMETNVYEAILIPSVGANLVKLYNKVKKVDILRYPEPDEMEVFLSRPQIFGIPLLFPPNRIEDGKYTFGDKKYQYPITIPDQHNYHHGIIKSQAFTVSGTRISSDAVEVETIFYSNKFNDVIYKNFPHEFICKIRFILTDNELTHIVSFRNSSSEPMPLGVGYHTPIRLPFMKNTKKEDYKLRLSVGKRWELSNRSLPTGNLLDLTEEEALLRTEGMTVTGKAIEMALTNEPLVVNGRDFSGAILSNTQKKIQVFYEVDKEFKHWTLWNNGGQVDWVCPEPQTWAINAPNLKLPPQVTGFQVVKPRETWQGTTRFYVK